MPTEQDRARRRNEADVLPRRGPRPGMPREAPLGWAGRGLAMAGLDRAGLEATKATYPHHAQATGARQTAFIYLTLFVLL